MVIENSNEPLENLLNCNNHAYHDGDCFFEDSPIEYMYIGRDLANYTFSYSSGQWRKTLNTVVFGDSVTYIPNSIFDSCYELSSVTMSNNVKNIGSFAFYNCNELTNITLPNELTSIGRAAFHSSGLVGVTIPSSVTSIEKNVFNSTQQLKSIVVEPGNSVYDSRLDCNAIIETSTNTLIRGCENTIIPNDVVKIDNVAFYACTGLESIVIPNSVTGIGDGAFQCCTSLKSVVIGNKVACIGSSAFYDCTNLRNLNFSSNPSIGPNAIPSTAKCHLILDDGNTTDFDITNANTYADVSYSRTIAEGKYGTIILPFTPNARSLENYAFYELAESGDGYMKFEEVAQPIANTPYIYTLREGKENVAITGGKTTISSNIETPVVCEWETIGSFSKQTIDTSNGNYYALSATDNEINRITKNLTVLPYRAYFKSANASKSALNIYISGTTGVEMISSNEIDGFENEAIFDLSGRKVAEPRKGNVYIKNGKKIMF